MKLSGMTYLPDIAQNSAPDGWPTSEIWVPHLRDSFIVTKVGYRS
jgi:hypothetical protein